MACSDLCGQKVLRACGELGIAVPEDVAVVGVDNDDLFCDLCDPPLSGVDPNFERIGYEAAAALARAILSRGARSNGDSPGWWGDRHGPRSCGGRSNGRRSCWPRPTFRPGAKGFQRRT